MFNQIFKFYAFLYSTGIIIYFLYSFTKESEFIIEENFLDEGCVPATLLKETNKQINKKLTDLVQTKFFRYFKVNLDQECPFWAQESICNSAGCAICICEEDEIPSIFKQETLETLTDKIQYDKQFKPMQYKEKQFSENYWDWRVEEFDIDSGVYVDLVDNIESYTGYQGQQIWTIINTENCFQGNEEDLCLEEKTLNRVLGGLHTSVNSHLSEYYVDFDKDRNHLYPNTTIYFQKVGNHKERIRNLYYYYSVLLRAINIEKNYLTSYNYTTGNLESDQKTHQLINEILNITTGQCDSPFNEKDFFNSFQTKQVKVQYQNYIHNISRLMDCVECEKCKTFGKMQVYGIGTALKILFSGGNEPPLLSKNEMIVLINAFTKVSTSIQIIDRMYKRRAHDIDLKELSIFIISSYILVFLFLVWYIKKLRKSYLQKRVDDYKEAYFKKQNQINIEKKDKQKKEKESTQISQENKKNQ